MKYLYTVLPLSLFGISVTDTKDSQKDIFGIAFIFFVSLVWLALLTNCSISKSISQSNNKAKQPTKHFSAAALNTERTAENTLITNATTFATHSSENTKM